MPLAFLAPVFLAGLAALAIPVLIHLANRPRKQVVEFPSLMFLERVEYRASSRRRLRNLVLFTLRSLALVLVAAAFARPYLDRPDAPATAPDGGREVVILLDRSGSMAVGDRMARARAAVAEVADGLRRGDRATLVAFDDEAAAANRATDQPAVLRAAADTVEPGAGATRLGPALRLAESVLSGSPLPRRVLVLVTDFQRTGWDAASAVRMSAGTEVRTVPVGDPVANAFVAGVRFGRGRFSGRDRVRVAATLAARGADERLDVELVVDGRTLQTRSVALEAGGVGAVEFDPVTLPDRAVRGTVRAGSDGLPADNAFHFVLSPSRSLRVLVVQPRGAAPYLARALAVGVEHDVAAVPPGRLEPALLAGVDVVVANGVDPDDAGVLRSFVDTGGGLLVVLGPRSRAGAWRDSGLLPGSLGGTREAATGAGLTAIRNEHPVFEAVRDAAGGLGGARFYRYREIEPAAGAEVLARFDDGAAALVASAAGPGRVLALAAPLDGLWSDLVLQPGFVPLVHRLVRYASAREPGPAWRSVGELLELESLVAVRDGDEGPAGDPGRGGSPVLLTPGDEALAVAPGQAHRLREAGFYEYRDPRSGGEPRIVAVNMDRSESEPALMDPEEVRGAIAGPEAPAAAASFAPQDQERRQALWWYFLVAAFLVMSAETMLSNRLSTKPLPPAAEGEPT